MIKRGIKIMKKYRHNRHKRKNDLKKVVKFIFAFVMLVMTFITSNLLLNVEAVDEIEIITENKYIYNLNPKVGDNLHIIIILVAFAATCGIIFKLTLNLNKK